MLSLGDRVWPRIVEAPIEADLRVMEQLRGHPRHGEALAVLERFVVEKDRLEAQGRRMRLAPLKDLYATLRFPENLAHAEALLSAAASREPGYAGLDVALASGSPKAIVDAFAGNPDEDWRGAVTSDVIRALKVYATSAGRTDAELRSLMQEVDRLPTTLQQSVQPLVVDISWTRRLDAAIASRSLASIVDAYTQAAASPSWQGAVESRVVEAVAQLVGVALGSEAGVSSALAAVERLPEPVRVAVGVRMDDARLDERLDRAGAARSLAGILDVYRLGNLRHYWQISAEPRFVRAVGGVLAASLGSSKSWDEVRQKISGLPSGLRERVDEAALQEMLRRFEDVLAKGDVPAMVAAYERGSVVEGWNSAAAPKLTRRLAVLFDPMRISRAKVEQGLASIDRLSGAEFAEFRAAVMAKLDYRSPTLGLMRLVPAGTFTMGYRGSQSEESYCNERVSTHKVTLTKAFYVMDREVTYGMWRSIMLRGASSGDDANTPVSDVSWYEVRKFIEALNAYEGTNYRLPTEAEWEYVARLGASRPYWGADDATGGVGSAGWYFDGCTQGRDGLGVCDMLDNLSEWTSDVFGPAPTTTATDPKGPSSGSSRVIRGAGWRYEGDCPFDSVRFASDPTVGMDDVGFRLVLPVR
jgi:formylglycine-generating enzyme required for sulfatase activity